MGKISALLAGNAFYIVSVYTMMATFMIGAMSGLVLWSSWASSRHGITTRALSHYDYIIVGGGTAGCVLAARLSADPKHSVLLVEAGEHFNWLSTIPLATPVLQGSTQDWAYSTKPQLHSSWGLLNQSSAWPRGRGLGGSGQLNYLLHYGGSEEDFARWEKSGAAGWGFAQLKHYLSRMLGFERNCMQHCANSYRNLLLSAAHPTCIQPQRGCSTIQVKPSMHVTQVDPEDSVLGQAFVKAGIELADTFKGIKFSTAQSTVFKGQRWSSLDGYLRPSLGRPNLHVLLNSQVSKVTIDRNRKVQGVELRGRDDHSVIRSNREVILSAGAINTPHILLQSGIGPHDELRKHGIPVVSDLHVGCNLHDHLNMPLYVSLEAPVSVTLDKVQRLHQLWDYMIHGTGLLSSSAIVGVGTTEPHLGLILFGLGSADEKLLRDIANYKEETFRSLFPFSHDRTQEGFVLLASCLQPMSRGTITLNDTDPSSKPMIDPNYLQDTRDVACMVQAVQLAVRVATSEPFKPLGAKVHLPNLEECRHLKADSENLPYLECIIRTAAITGYHPGGTCKMGSANDETTVVDPLLRVRGLEGLRVVDASLMPTPVSGHPNSILIAVAENAADIILKQ